MDTPEMQSPAKESSDSPPQSRVIPRLLAAVCLLLLFLFLKDISNFVRICAHYRDKAYQGLNQITPDVRESEAIVVLTGGQGRIPRSLELLRARGSSLLIISGVAKGISLTELVNQQGDSTINIHEIWKKIILEYESSSTIENAEQSAAILARHRARRVILVTSDLHMDRSLDVFHKVLPQIEILDYSVPSSLLRGKNRLDGFWKIATEYWKNRLFRLFYSGQVQPFRSTEPK